jgi:hypothetical protein
MANYLLLIPLGIFIPMFIFLVLVAHNMNVVSEEHYQNLYQQYMDYDCERLTERYNEIKKETGQYFFKSVSPSLLDAYYDKCYSYDNYTGRR